jgi:cytosine/adenosine deaminase-related metal-dependent hydrolase
VRSRRPFLTTLLSAAIAGPAAAQSPTLVIRHVNVVDVVAGEVLPDQTVVVRGDRIAAIGASRDLAASTGPRIVDGRGRFLIPGLWDMHVHTVVPSGRPLLALYVANGVTGVRDMAGEWDTLRHWRAEIASGALVGPRIVASGPYLEGGEVPIPHLLTRTPEEARLAVDSLARLGVDFIKVHGQLTRDTYFAAARAARERRIPFAGHVARGVTAAEASDSGQRSLEHLLAIPIPCTAADTIALRPRFPLQAFLGRCTLESMTPLFARFVANGTWIVPTF